MRETMTGLIGFLLVGFAALVYGLSHPELGFLLKPLEPLSRWLHRVATGHTHPEIGREKLIGRTVTALSDSEPRVLDTGEECHQGRALVESVF